MKFQPGPWQNEVNVRDFIQRNYTPYDGDSAFLKAKIATSRFFADHVLSQAPGLAASIVRGAPGALALAEEQF